jgi:hypothetical protein
MPRQRLRSIPCESEFRAAGIILVVARPFGHRPSPAEVRPPAILFVPPRPDPATIVQQTLSDVFPDGAVRTIWLRRAVGSRRSGSTGRIRREALRAGSPTAAFVDGQPGAPGGARVPEKGLSGFPWKDAARASPDCRALGMSRSFHKAGQYVGRQHWQYVLHFRQQGQDPLGDLGGGGACVGMPRTPNLRSWWNTRPTTSATLKVPPYRRLLRRITVSLPVTRAPLTIV